MLSLLLGVAAAVADVPPVPNPALIHVPDLAADTRPLGNEKKFFVFHRAGGTFEEALTDLRFCFRFANQPLWNPPPEFVPWVEANQTKNNEPVLPPYGVVGVLMDEAFGITASVERSNRQINMMSCMLPRGYVRYRISEPLWHELNGKSLEQSLLLQAKIASGPAPTTPRVNP